MEWKNPQSRAANAEHVNCHLTELDLWREQGIDASIRANERGRRARAVHGSNVPPRYLSRLELQLV
jgi:hypothetical protein